MPRRFESGINKDGLWEERVSDGSRELRRSVGIEAFEGEREKREYVDYPLSVISWNKLEQRFEEKGAKGRFEIGFHDWVLDRIDSFEENPSLIEEGIKFYMAANQVTEDRISELKVVAGKPFSILIKIDHPRQGKMEISIGSKVEASDSINP